MANFSHKAEKHKVEKDRRWAVRSRAFTSVPSVKIPTNKITEKRTIYAIERTIPLKTGLSG